MNLKENVFKNWNSLWRNYIIYTKDNFQKKWYKRTITKENEIKEAVRLATTLNTKHVLAFDSNNGHTVIVKPTEVSDDILSICINESYEEAQEAEQEWWSNIGSKYFQKNAIHENL